MVDFEKNILAKYTPCIFTTQNEIIEALAIVHTELVLIHPFREGNGRLARLVSTLMGLQSGYPALNFSVIDGDGKEEYFAAVRDGLDCLSCTYYSIKWYRKFVISGSGQGNCI